MKIICLSLLLFLPHTTVAATQWSLARVYIRNTVGAVDHDLEELAEEFPQLSEYKAHAQVTDLSIFYSKGGCVVSLHFRYPVGPDETLPPEARVFGLKNGKRVATWSRVKSDEDAAGKKFEKVVGGLVRARQAQLLDLLGADTRGSTRDLDAAPFDGHLEAGKLYRAELVFEKENWDWRTAVPVRPPIHHAASIEWENLTDFPSFYFDRPKDERPEVVFEVVGKEVQNVGGRAWRTTYRCRVLGVEAAPPRAEYLTLVAKCRRVIPNRKRNPGYNFNFEVRRVVAGSFDAREFGIELTAETGGGPLLRALGGGDFSSEDYDCSGASEVEMTFELPRGERDKTRPGLLQEFRVIE